jgi:hypothetical protein
MSALSQAWSSVPGKSWRGRLWLAARLVRHGGDKRADRHRQDRATDLDAITGPGAEQPLRTERRVGARLSTGLRTVDSLAAAGYGPTRQRPTRIFIHRCFGAKSSASAASGTATGMLLGRADGTGQAAAVGRHAAGRVGFFLHVFLHVEDFDVAYARMASAGVQFRTAPRAEAYGRLRRLRRHRRQQMGPDRSPDARLTAPGRTER